MAQAQAAQVRLTLGQYVAKVALHRRGQSGELDFVVGLGVGIGGGGKQPLHILAQAAGGHGPANDNTQDWCGKGGRQQPSGFLLHDVSDKMDKKSKKR